MNRYACIYQLSTSPAHSERMLHAYYVPVEFENAHNITNSATLLYSTTDALRIVDTLSLPIHVQVDSVCYQVRPRRTIL